MSATLSQTPTVPVSTFAPESDAAVRETVIAPKKGWIAVDWGELVRQRELLYFLVWRDIKVRYKQAMLGFAWAILQPLTQVIVFSLIFGAGFNLGSRFGGDPSKMPPYAIFVFAALLPWQFFSRSLSDGGLSLVNQQHLLTKIYFPRLYVPTAAVGGALVDTVISFAVFLVMVLFYRFGLHKPVTPPWTIVFLPFLVLGTSLLSLGMAYLLAALTVTYRDFRFIIQFAVQIWMWVSFVMIPVPGGMLGRKMAWVVLYANPMYGYVSTYRKILVPNVEMWSPWNWTMLASSVGMSVAFFLLGIFYFRRTERRFADIA